MNDLIARVAPSAFQSLVSLGIIGGVVVFLLRRYAGKILDIIEPRLLATAKSVGNSYLLWIGKGIFQRAVPIILRLRHTQSSRMDVQAEWTRAKLDLFMVLLLELLFSVGPFLPIPHVWQNVLGTLSVVTAIGLYRIGKKEASYKLAYEIEQDPEHLERVFSTIRELITNGHLDDILGIGTEQQDQAVPTRAKASSAFVETQRR